MIPRHGVCISHGLEAVPGRGTARLRRRPQQPPVNLFSGPQFVAISSDSETDGLSAALCTSFNPPVGGLKKMQLGTEAW